MNLKLSTESDISLGSALLYVRINDQGHEAQQPAVAWAWGPKIAGLGEVLWCVSRGQFVGVVVVSKRHRTRGGLGRYVDPGERYTDSWARSRAAQQPIERDGWGLPKEPVLWRTEDGRKVGERRQRPPWRGWAKAGDRAIQVLPLPTDVYKTLSGEG